MTSGPTTRGAPTELPEHRRRLHAAMVELETAATTAAARPAEFRDRLAAALGRLASTLDDHIAWTEDPGGLFEQVVEVEPRVDAKVHRLRGEHRDLSTGTTELLARCRGELLDADEVEQVRERVLDLLGVLARHRQRGADLLYEAYAVDVAAGD